MKSNFFVICLSLMAIGCAESGNKGGGYPSPALTCADDIQICSAPKLTALYSGGVFYLNEDTGINQPIKISEGGKQTFYAIVYDADILSGESTNVAINSRPIKLNANVADSLNDYVSSAIKMASDSVPSALENYTYAEGYEIFNFTLGENPLLDDRVVGEHEISVIPIDAHGLKGSTDLFKVVVVIENVNDEPEISVLTPSGGVISSSENIFEVFEGGEDGIIRVAVRDVDIQHGDIIGLNITGVNLPAGVISIERDKLSQPDARNNQVEFIVHIASGLMQDTDIGEYPFSFLVYDEFGGVEDRRNITLKVKNTDDASSATYLGTSVEINKLDSMDGIPDTFTISEGQSGQIEVTISDEDLVRSPLIVSNITGDSIDLQIISWVVRTKPSSPDERILTIDVGSDLIDSHKIDDEHIGTYELSLNISSPTGEVGINYPFTLQIINVEEQPRIIEILPGTGISSTPDGNSFILTQDVAAVFSIVVEDEDFANPQNQESIKLTITESTLPKDFITIEQSEINRSNAPKNTHVTFKTQFAASTYELVGNHSITFSVADLSGNTALAPIKIIIENVNDEPEIYALTPSGGVISSSENIFEVFEGGEDGIIRVAVRDVDIQHGDIIGLNITGVNLPSGVISIERDKLSQPNATNNQVEFIVHIASGLMQDTDIGEYPFSFLVYDEFGGVEDRRNITLKVKNTDDASSAIYLGTSVEINKLDSMDGIPDTFTISEGQSGQIEVTISDEDLVRSPLIVSNITGDSVDLQIISWVVRTKPSSPDERILTINVGSDLIDSQKIDDEHIGTYELSLNISSPTGEVGINYPFTLQIINVEEQPRIIEILPGTGISSTPDGNSFILTQDVAAVFSIVVEDEDFANPQNQENITIAASYPTDPNSPFLTLISYDSPQINLPDTTGGKNVTFVVKIAAPPNNFVGENTLSITAIDSSAQSVSLNMNLNILNVNDAPSIVDITSSGSVRRRDIGHFIVAEGASPNGRINVIVEDIDFISQDSISLTVASATLDTRFISVAKAHIDESDADSNHQVTFNIDIPSELLDDAEVRTHILEINATDVEGESVMRQVNLVVENTNDAPKIISITPEGGIRKAFLGGIDEQYLYRLDEGSSGLFNIKIADEDLIHSDGNITVRFANPLSSELLSLDKQFFSSADMLDDGTFNLTIRLGADADFDDRHVGQYTLNLSIFDGVGAEFSREKSRIRLEIVNVPERPFFTQDSHDIAVFEQSGAIKLPVGTVVATIGEEYCSGKVSPFGCSFALPVLRAADDPDAGDAARLSYLAESIGSEYFYIDGLQIKNLVPLNVGDEFSFRIIAQDNAGNQAAEKPLVKVWVRSSNNLNKDFDKDGVRDPYDGDPANSAIKAMGKGTRDDPYLIYNVYQLQAIAGVDHQGNGLGVSEFTGNSYLYGDDVEGQLSSHYRLANDVRASSTSIWNSGSGFMSIGVGNCNSDDKQCDATTAARRISAITARFSGTFDGANFEISGLTIKKQSSYIGLFGAAGDGSVIANVTLTSAEIINTATRSAQTGGIKFSYGGLLVGQMLGGTIDNVRVNGTLTGVGFGYGGVVGSIDRSNNPSRPGIIKNSMADVDVTANGVGFGGLVGSLGTNSFIHASNAKGDVRSVVNNESKLITKEVGGLVGISYGNIFASYASGYVRGFASVGGLVGSSQNGATTASFAAGDVEGVRYVGGLLGIVSGGTHKHLYYSGQLIRSLYIPSSSEYVGGIAGDIIGSPTIHSAINMRSTNPNTLYREGGLIFGRIDLRVVTNRPQIYYTYTIWAPNGYLGYLLHEDDASGAAPLSVLGGRYWTVRLVLEEQLRNCRIGGKSYDDTPGCDSIFPNNFWGEKVVSSIGSSFTVSWLFNKVAYPTFRVQPVLSLNNDGTPKQKGSSILPSHEEQRCYIEPEYTHPTHCPTTPR